MKSLYIVPFHQNSQEIIILLGIVDFLKSRYRKVAIFKPIVDDKMDISIIEDNTITLFTKDEVKACISSNDTHLVIEKIINKFAYLKKEYDFILIDGFDKYKLQLPFELNLEISKNLNSPIVAILNGLNKDTKDIDEEINISKSSIDKSGADYFMTFVTNSNIKSTNQLIRYIPSIDILSISTMDDIYSQLDFQKIYGDDKNLNKQILSIKIAAMGVENVLANIKDGDLIVVPSDRVDVILGVLLALKSSQLPHICGIVLTSSIPLNTNIMKLLQTIDELNIVILQSPYDTFDTTKKLQIVKPKLTFKSYSKIAKIKGIFQDNTEVEIFEKILHKNKHNIMTPIMFEYSLFQKAIKDKKHIVLPEASDDRILRATDILLHRKIVNITLLGDEKVIKYRAKVLGLDISVANIINPKTSTLTQKLADSFFNLRKHKGITKEFAYDMIIEDKNYFATMMIKENLADGMVSGSSSTTANTVRPALQIIKTKPNIDIVSSAFFMCMDTKVLVFADCAINQSPNVKDLANIAISSAMTAKDFGIDAKIAMLSYSTGNSSSSNEVQKVKDAVELIKKLEPSLNVVGPIQYDAAINKTIAMKKLSNSTIMGDATILIFPDLNTGNNTYKAVQNSGNTIAIGPVLQGLNGAINDLSRGATVADIVNTVALTAIQAQGLR